MKHSSDLEIQNVFVMGDGGDISGELERRKFTAEEGDHLTLLNGMLGP